MADEIRNGGSKVRSFDSSGTHDPVHEPSWIRRGPIVRESLMSADAQPDVLDVRFPTRRILAIIGDKWTTVVLYCLSIREHRRFNELQKQRRC